MNLLAIGFIVTIAAYVAAVGIHFNNGFPAADALVEGVMADAEFAANCLPPPDALVEFLTRPVTAGHDFDCRLVHPPGPLVEQ